MFPNTLCLLGVFKHPNNKKARYVCGLLVCNAYALASDHPIKGDNNHAGGV